LQHVTHSFLNDSLANIAGIAEQPFEAKRSC